MSIVTLKGVPARISGELPQVDQKAPDFRYVKQDLSDGFLADHRGKPVVLLFVPSLDTGICAIETKRFNHDLANSGADVLVLSIDTPFAMKRFCTTESIDGVTAGSDFRYGDIGKAYGVRIEEGPMHGALARAIVIIDKEGLVRHTQLVPEIAQEPDYGPVLEAVKHMA